MTCRVLTPYPYSGVKIMFDPTVEVTESTRVHTPLTIISNIGGVLGLCLGYSLLDGGWIVRKAANIVDIVRLGQKLIYEIFNV